MKNLQKLGCECFPSQANFVFFSTPYDAGEIAEMLLKVGVIVRPCGGWGYNNILEYQLVQQNRTRFSLKNLRRFLKH
mgnify:CR=1 FL=1